MTTETPTQSSETKEVEAPQHEHEASTSSSSTPAPPAEVADRVEYARQKLEEKKMAKAVENFQETHEAEIKRRNLGREMADFKVCIGLYMSCHHYSWVVAKKVSFFSRKEGLRNY